MLSVFSGLPAVVGQPLPLPLFDARIKAGFPSPAESYTERSLDLNRLAVRNPAATYFLRVSGDSMEGAGILDGDLVVVDRSLHAMPGDVVIAEFGGEFTIKHLQYRRGRPVLVPANPRYPELVCPEGQELVIAGVVRGVFRELRA